jgi:hypothetical protein
MSVCQYFLLPAACYLLSAVCYLLSASCLLHAVCCLLPLSLVTLSLCCHMSLRHYVTHVTSWHAGLLYKVEHIRLAPTHPSALLCYCTTTHSTIASLDALNQSQGSAQ